MTAAPPSVPQSPLRTHSFRWFFTGRVVSLLGSSMAPVSLAFAVLHLTRNPVDLGLVLAAQSVSLVLFLLVGGAIADRFPRSRVLIVANLGAAVSQGLVATLLILGTYNLTVIVALEFVNGMLSAFTSPAMRGIVPELVDRDQIQQANSLLGSSRNAIRIFGPTIAGLIVATAGGGWALAIDAASYFLAAVCMARLSLPQQMTSKGSVLGDIRDGWTGFRSITWVWTIVAAFCVTNFVQVAIWTVLGPTVAEHTIGATSWGVVLSAKAVGLLVMSVIMYRLTVRRLLSIGQLSMLLGSLPLLALGAGLNVAMLVAAAFVAGLGSGLFGIAWETSLQEHVPNNLLSRISSYDDLGSFIAIPLGQVLVGPIAAAFGAGAVALVGGAVYAVAVLMPLLSPAVRELRHQP
jgi:MFS family permease